MLYAVKFWAQATEQEKQFNAGIPLDWPWNQVQIEDAQSQSFLSLGWTLFTSDEYLAYIQARQQSFDTWWANREEQRNATRLKVLDLVQDEFAQYHPSKIDFTIHLRPNVVLNKKTTMLKNGRPEKSEYYYNGDKICEIKFEFEANAQNFVTSRTEKLGYVQGNGEISTYYTIHSKQYDMTNFTDKAAVTEERVEARQYIMKEIKAVLNDVLGLYYIVLPPAEEKKTPEQLWQMAGIFWNAYSSDIDSWFNTATQDFKQKIIDDVQFDFLNLVVPPQISQEADAKTVRQYIVDRITY